MMMMKNTKTRNQRVRKRIMGVIAKEMVNRRLA